MNTETIEQIQINITPFEDLASQVNQLGRAEYRLAVAKALANNTSVEAEIESWRAKFAEGKVANLGPASFATPDVWLEIANASEAAAKREILKHSAMLVTADAAEEKAKQAKAEADEANRQLEALWSEYQRLPGAVDKLQARIASIRNAEQSLDNAQLEANFKDLYRAHLNGAIIQAGAIEHIASMIITRALRLEVLHEVRVKLEIELNDAKARLKAVSKKLGQKN